MGWSLAQKKAYAKEVMAGPFQNGRAGTYLTTAMRRALVKAYCLGIVTGQAAETVRVVDVQDLLTGICEAICARWGAGFFDD